MGLGSVLGQLEAGLCVASSVWNDGLMTTHIDLQLQKELHLK